VICAQPPLQSTLAPASRCSHRVALLLGSLWVKPKRPNMFFCRPHSTLNFSAILPLMFQTRPTRPAAKPKEAAPHMAAPPQPAVVGKPAILSGLTPRACPLNREPVRFITSPASRRHLVFAMKHLNPCRGGGALVVGFFEGVAPHHIACAAMGSASGMVAKRNSTNTPVLTHSGPRPT